MRTPRSERIACSFGALALAIALWVVLASNAGEPVRAAGVVAFLAAPALLGARFAFGLGPLVTGVVALASSAATIGVLAAAAFAASWSPHASLLGFSVLVGLCAGFDLLRAFTNPGSEASGR